jgi:hypothetical protein
MAIITLAETSGKGFWKSVDSIDRQYADGRSLSGEFIDGGKEVEIANGSYVVRRWTGRKNQEVAMYRVDATSNGDAYSRNAGLVQIGSTYNWDASLLSFISHVEATLAAVDPRAEAIAQIKALMLAHGITAGDL